MMYPKVNAVIALLVSSTEFNMEEPDICIGGHCRTGLRAHRSMVVEEAFKLVSEIDDDIIASMVCYPTVAGSYEATVPQAVKMLEYLRDYGIVDWEKALEETDDQG